MIEKQFAEWVGEAVDNAPVIAFLLLGLWDMRRTITLCMKQNHKTLERLIEQIARRD